MNKILVDKLGVCFIEEELFNRKDPDKKYFVVRHCLTDIAYLIEEDEIKDYIV